MVPLIAGGVTAAAVAAVGTTIGLIRRFMDRYIIVANGTSQPICVTVEHDKGKNQSLIEAEESMKFTVSNNRPITIRAKKYTKSAYDAEVCNYDYRNYIVRKATIEDLILVRAKKWNVWEAEPCKQNKQKDFVKGNSPHLQDMF
ncbi:uncharacterized protein LOC115927082 [Strongylocentrotus purpuratus]|uniref:Uncharacterized protein n=1 Tax=Strongylocentrotus purpuratus TaxID=7668 RepID=A0A7M7PCQ6_STRPU|nr:uncharacterized protein LOC115927082 [Strongylocentrotus purpuratus]